MFENLTTAEMAAIDRVLTAKLRRKTMPSTSKKQHNFMEGIAHGMTPRSGKGPSPAVAKEFVAADKGRTFKRGGKVKKGRK